MAIGTSALCDSFKQQLLLAVHDFHTSATGGDTFYLALYTSAATLDNTTTAYTATGETTNTSGSAYSAGGIALTNSGTSIASGTPNAGTTTFGNVSWSTASFSADGCLIYNNTPSATDNGGSALTKPSVMVLNFGGTKTATAGTFTITMPALGSTALIRIA